MTPTTNKTVQNINLKELTAAITQICEEKGLDQKTLIQIISEALAAAYKKDYGRRGQIIKADFDPQTQTASFYQIKQVVDKNTRVFETQTQDSNTKHQATQKETVPQVQKKDQTQEQPREALPKFSEERDILLKDAKEIKKGAKVGDEIKIKLKPQNQFGRVAAQNAKQVIIQKLREAERDNLYNEFKDKEGQVVTATVQRIENHNVYLDLGKMIGVLFPGEQIPQENYRVGQRIKVYVDRVSQDFKDTTVILSRSNPKLVVKLFQLEVPEIFAGTVTIESIAREAGSRSKIAVKSEDPSIDPIGSCVGQKGIRVQAIIDELGGEKIDIIEFNPDAKSYISQALAPAKIKYVDLNQTEQEALAIVEPDQLSLAIGKKGQNVRLAARLTGWKIDVRTEEDQDRNLESKSTEQTDQQEKSTEPDQESATQNQKSSQDQEKNQENQPKTEKTKKADPTETKTVAVKK
ncbi:MAG: transcription termination/antitermination protein NusA [Candidatus Moranbacteria bacterium]|nr:transcription termination/antitermination protein NusA [Candidatus Moranbacteria bacterium]